MNDWLDSSQELEQLRLEANAQMDEMAEECPSELKLAVTRWVMKHIVDHAKEGGSYRYLIYDRLGFGPEAYVPLLDDGMFISNEFDVEQINKIKTIVKEQKIDSLKEVLYLCDEPGCYDSASSGWPTEKGYRQTCYKHYKKHKYNKV